jgi:hypothetical protein
MDNSKTRRGKECWYHKVGLEAINDGTIMCKKKTNPKGLQIQIILKEMFKKDKFVLIDLFNDVKIKIKKR